MISAVQHKPTEHELDEIIVRKPVVIVQVAEGVDDIACGIRNRYLQPAFTCIYPSERFCLFVILFNEFRNCFNKFFSGVKNTMFQNLI